MTTTTIRSRILGLAAAALLALAGIGGIGVGPAFASSLAFTITGDGATHTIGDSVTVTPASAGVAIDTCIYWLSIYGNDGNAASSWTPSMVTRVQPTAGDNTTCPVWTFTLPNVTKMVDNADATNVQVTVLLQILTTSGSVVTALGHGFWYPPGAGTPTPASNLPAMMWTLSPTKVSLNGSFVATPTLLVPAGYTPISASVGGCAAQKAPISAAAMTWTSVYSGQMTCAAVSATNTSVNGTAVIIAAGGPNWQVGADIAAWDPPIAPAPTVAPTATPAPTVAPSAKPIPTVTTAPTTAPTANLDLLSDDQIGMVATGHRHVVARVSGTDTGTIYWAEQEPATAPGQMPPAAKTLAETTSTTWTGDIACADLASDETTVMAVYEDSGLGGSSIVPACRDYSSVTPPPSSTDPIGGSGRTGSDYTGVALLAGALAFVVALVVRRRRAEGLAL